MHDFAAQVGESVRTARELRPQQADALRREGEDTARELREAQDQASEPVATTWDRSRTAALPATAPSSSIEAPIKASRSSSYVGRRANRLGRSGSPWTRRTG